MDGILIPYKYTYLSANIVSLLIWLYIFIKRKDLRKEMVVMGLLFMSFGPLLENIFYSKDWWRPEAVTTTWITLEDLSFAFLNTGIAVAIYEFIFSKRFTRIKKLTHVNLKKTITSFVTVSIIVLAVMSFLFFFVQTSSFIANTVGLVLGSLYVLWKRRDLVAESIGTAICFPLTVFPVFWFTHIVSPGWVESTWQLNKLSGILVLGVPVEDLIWYSLCGLLAGGLFEFLFNYRLKK